MSAANNRSLGMLLFLAAPVLMLAWVAFENTQEDRAAAERPFHGIAGVRSQAESDQAAALLADAFSVLRSPAFHANLRSLQDAYPRIYARRSHQEATPDEVARLVSLEAPGSRYAPVEVFVTGADDPADMSREQAEAGEGPGSGRFSDMVLGRAILEQHRSADLVERSCAINVAAHEYAHTISILPVKFTHAFTDTNDAAPTIADRRHPETPIGSYFIGAVAQCTWLQGKGRVSAHGLRACVEVFGTRSMNGGRCGSFRDGQPVAPRPDLPPPNRPL